MKNTTRILTIQFGLYHTLPVYYGNVRGLGHPDLGLRLVFLFDSITDVITNT